MHIATRSKLDDPSNGVALRLPPFATLLRSLARGAPLDGGFELTAAQRSRVVDLGLGPLMYQALKNSGHDTTHDPDATLRAADMTSRVLTAELFENISHVIRLLARQGLRPIMLKGVALAARYYPEPHLRLMGDVDVLLPADKVPLAEHALVVAGFRPLAPAPGMDYDQHIHSAPLFHNEGKLWVELHRRLIKDDFAVSHEAPLDLTDWEKHTLPCTIAGSEALSFKPEFELVYLAASWCFNLANGFDGSSAQRSLADATLLLKQCSETLDWELIQRWSKGSLLGACLFVLLSLLKGIGAYDDRNDVCRALARDQRFVNGATYRLMRPLLLKHVVGLGEYGRWSSPNVNGLVCARLLRKQSAWINLVTLPTAVVFPSNEPERFNPLYQLGRVSRMLGLRR